MPYPLLCSAPPRLTTFYLSVCAAAVAMAVAMMVLVVVIIVVVDRGAGASVLQHPSQARRVDHQHAHPHEGLKHP